jgi:hypothetical protein
MGTYQTPSKEQVRQYLQLRFTGHRPVPSISEIQDALGWVEHAEPEGSGFPHHDALARGKKGEA